MKLQLQVILQVSIHTITHELQLQVILQEFINTIKITHEITTIGNNITGVYSYNYT